MTVRLSIAASTRCVDRVRRNRLCRSPENVLTSSPIDLLITRTRGGDSEQLQEHLFGSISLFHSKCEQQSRGVDASGEFNASGESQAEDLMRHPGAFVGAVLSQRFEWSQFRIQLRPCISTERFTDFSVVIPTRATPLCRARCGYSRRRYESARVVLSNRNGVVIECSL